MSRISFGVNTQTMLFVAWLARRFDLFSSLRTNRNDKHLEIVWSALTKELEEVSHEHIFSQMALQLLQHQYEAFSIDVAIWAYTASNAIYFDPEKDSLPPRETEIVLRSIKEQKNLQEHLLLLALEVAWQEDGFRDRLRSELLHILPESWLLRELMEMSIGAINWKDILASL